MVEMQAMVLMSAIGRCGQSDNEPVEVWHKETKINLIMSKCVHSRIMSLRGLWRLANGRGGISCAGGSLRRWSLENVVAYHLDAVRTAEKCTLFAKRNLGELGK